MRSSGILLGVASLPGEYGIGKLGSEARDFVDFLVDAKQKYWQILPLSPTGFGDSPYQSFSSRAGNPYFIDFETLEADGLLTPEDYKDVDFGADPIYIDYGQLYNTVFKVLRKAYARFGGGDEYNRFLEKNADWAPDYALFMAEKNLHGGSPWYEWEEDLRMAEPETVAKARRDLADEIGFQLFLQFEFYKQWFALKSYANSRGVQIIGDMPIYCAYDSVEAWLSPELFEFDAEKKPKCVAGCPPDGYAAEGQLWGNPLYNWADMEQNGYKWWIDRIGFETDIYDVLRIDHFRAFAGYYSVPWGDKNAINGFWREGPRMKLFNSTNYWLGKKNIIAEDLGFITGDVSELIAQTGYSGMKVLQFAFDPSSTSKYLPTNYADSRCIVYTSTHDSDTALGWAEKLEGRELSFCLDYCGVKSRAEIPDALLRLAWGSTAETAITQLQDLLGLDNSARINVPSTVGLNWRWRASKEQLCGGVKEKLRNLTETYNRAGAISWSRPDAETGYVFR